MSKIGVFWAYNGIVFGKAVEQINGIEGVPGLIDCHDNHADVWDVDRPWAAVSPSLASTEYQDIPRGRVLFSTKLNQPLVYLDKALMNLTYRQKISQFFELTLGDVIWRSDAHYTTSQNALDALFSDDAD